jgi:N-acetylmuramoyl-L-alanine amidase
MRIKNVVLDFGHGGLEKTGRYTTAPNKMFVHADGEPAYEGVLNRLIGGHVYTCLRSHQDLNIVCTVKQDDPRDIALSRRVRTANQYEASETLFVSIHCNASPRHNANGFELFTTIGTTTSDVLAESIATSVENMDDQVELKLRYDFSDGDKDKEADFYVLRKTKCPAVLLECGFFDNSLDYGLLRDPLIQSDYGFYIYKGIVNFIENETGP